MITGAITLTEALSIAEREIGRVISESPELAGYSFGQVSFLREGEQVWTFAAGSRELLEQGYVPGAVIVSVDKHDGHVWSREEQERYARQCVQERQPVTVAGTVSSSRNVP